MVDKHPYAVSFSVKAAAVLKSNFNGYNTSYPEISTKQLASSCGQRERSISRRNANRKIQSTQISIVLDAGSDDSPFRSRKEVFR